MGHNWLYFTTTWLVCASSVRSIMARTGPAGHVRYRTDQTYAEIYTNLHKSAVHEFLALLESLHVHKFTLFAENSRSLHEIELST